MMSSQESNRSGYDPTASTTSIGLPSSELGLARDMNAEAEQGGTTRNTSIVMYTFSDGPMGITLEDAQGGTRVLISDVSDKSQAERLGVPVGGTIMRVADGLQPQTAC